jgi:hypothetical protein
MPAALISTSSTGSSAKRADTAVPSVMSSWSSRISPGPGK